jgi:thymidylate synthase ThyX
MSHRTSAKVVLDSITPHGSETRLMSMYVIFPKMIIGERNRHRAFSLSDRSSRAVPPEKLIDEVVLDPAMPAKFRRRSKGMGGGEELVGDELVEAQERWRRAAFTAAGWAGIAAKAGEAKETANRPIDPYIRMHSLMTATRDCWLNFFGLRLDEGADPTIQVLAQRCFEVYKDSTPKLLEPGEWHLPFVDDDEVFQNSMGPDVWTIDDRPGKGLTVIEVAKRLSAARCAHLSYNDLETGKRMTVDRALLIYDKLVTSRPLHASPCEHQATPDEWRSYAMKREEVDAGTQYGEWVHRSEHGNLLGWRQARKMLPGEAVAPLPEGYEL